MGQSKVRNGEAAQSRREHHADELGWDESLYEGGEKPPANGDGGSGDSGGGRGGRGGGGRTPRRKRRILAWVAGGTALLVLAAAAAGYAYVEHLNRNIQKDELNLGEHRAARPTPNAAGQTPLNILLIGSDARDSKENQKLGGARSTFGSPPLADVQMLVHLSADRSNMSVVSMPRDTLVKIPQCTDSENDKVYPASTGLQMTNTTLGRGGAGCTVATWEELTGIHIDHFMMVDFAGVVSMADAIGGVPVCVDANIYSHTSEGKGSGLKLKKGTHAIKGEQALQWLRTRYGFEDGSDIGRTKAQHMYMNSMVRELRENATLTNPGKLRSLAEEATKALTVDPGLDSVKKLFDLSNQLRRVAPKRITMTTMPWRWAVSDHNRVEPEPEDAEQLFRLVREDIALDGKDKKKKVKLSDDPAAPAEDTAVSVQNATRTDTLAPAPGRGGEVTQTLIGKGYDRATADTTTAVEGRKKTVVRFPATDLEGDAQVLAKSLKIPLRSVKKSSEVTDITVVIGADWRTGTVYPKKKSLDDLLPDSADALNGSDTSACMKVNTSFTW
ncbi:LCP family protein [Streptomyces tsukubensis]|uniref:Transcriptional regulator n=1 Tax=Streptomyces tsukubensis TaxID=83656 RepID=A0A1V4A2P0_9ACTN|nr:LCP family protein [Streptomyces tsukubensis]OON72973.1 transcriptional regulator [Streptomyces tsukubensis]QFR93956.1 LytR family transcriptional regulator [Streptomyces tsukubensis]